MLLSIALVENCCTSLFLLIFLILLAFRVLGFWDRIRVVTVLAQVFYCCAHCFLNKSWPYVHSPEPLFCSCVISFLHYSNFESECNSIESVDSIMQESHELDGTTVVVDRATPKVPYSSEIEL